MSIKMEDLERKLDKKKRNAILEKLEENLKYFEEKI